MKSTAKQENNSNFEKYSSSPLICSDPSPGGLQHLLWRSQIVYIIPYSLKITTAIYFVIECSDIAVFAGLRVCVSQCIRTLPGLDQFRN